MPIFKGQQKQQQQHQHPKQNCTIFFQSGYCMHGNRCHFSHGRQPGPLKVEKATGSSRGNGERSNVCFDWQSGVCDRPNCCFDHFEDGREGQRSNSAMFQSDGANDKCLPLSFDLPLTELVIVDGIETMKMFCVSIDQAVLVGIDTETQPNFTPKKSNPNRQPDPTSLMQVAVRQQDKRERVFILDLLKLLRDTNEFDSTIQEVFGCLFLDPSIIKLGQGLPNDIRELVQSYVRIKSFGRVISCLEMNALHKVIAPDTRRGESLKNLTRIYLNRNLVKKQQTSSWGRRPLKEAQIRNAACDALVLLRLYDKMTAEAGDIIGRPFDGSSLFVEVSCQQETQQGISFAVLIPTVMTVICYSVYTISGLQLIILSFVTNKETKPVISWAASVILLAVGNVFNAISIFGYRIILHFLRALFIVFVFEEVGLRYGVVFGRYEFTDGLGVKITERLPALVLVLWTCILYPSILLGIAIFTGSPIRMVSNNRRVLFSVISAGLVVMFDIVSEPIGVLFGNKIWHHAAFIDADCTAYTDVADWVYKDNQPLSSYYGIPIHNFIGWYCVSFIVSLDFSFSIDVKSVQSSQKIISWLPVGVALFSTILFYVIHPCHPSGVKTAGILYIFIIVSLFYLKICREPSC